MTNSERQKAKEALLTQRRLKEILHYDPETGMWVSIIRRIGIWGRGGVGKQYTTISTAGYIRINIDGEIYYAHRLAFLYMTGAWPNKQVDHANRNKADNRWVNLRLATHGQNMTNSGQVPVSGYRGVHKNGTGWVAFIGREPTYLGYFNRIENAALAYNFAAHRRYGEFAKFNKGGPCQI